MCASVPLTCHLVAAARCSVAGAIAPWLVWSALWLGHVTLPVSGLMYTVIGEINSSAGVIHTVAGVVCPLAGVIYNVV